MTAGVLTAGFLALLAVVVANGRRPLGVDDRLLATALDARTSTGLRLARAVTTLGSGAVLLPLLVLVGLLVWRATGHRMAALTPVLLLLGGQLVRDLVMLAVARPRPPAVTRAAAAAGSAFPSGHTTSATLGWGLAAITLVLLRARRAGDVTARRQRTRWPVGVALAGPAALVAALVGASRVYLGVHWGTDVLAGWLLGGALLAAASVPLSRVVGGRARGWTGAV